ncbi:hypothetical protein [Paenibacillus dendritiformis]|uniref:hypothetical protein n=1 Tax=Paenibacillus dendritiformis TaxID=130049 RepID=UPI000DAF4C3C|nr:hypothetical protein [Paenibacillus dendritiformis]PZM65503.1 hypothetical protein DOE73_10990 [Paenibacillus dendritiformis]
MAMINRVTIHVHVIVLLAIAPGCTQQAQRQPAPDAPVQREFDRNRLNASSSEGEAPNDVQSNPTNQSHPSKQGQSLSQGLDLRAKKKYCWTFRSSRKILN